MKHFTEIKIEQDRYQVLFFSQVKLRIDYVHFPINRLCGAINYSIDINMGRRFNFDLQVHNPQ